MNETSHSYTYLGVTLKETLRRDGRYQATGRWIDTGRPRSFFSRIPGEAAKAAARTLARVPENTLGAFYLSVYLPTIAHRSESWRYQVKWAWDGYLLPLAPKPIDQLKRTDVQKLFNQIVAKVNPNSARKIKIVLSCIFNLAVDDEVIARNPAARIRIPRGAPPNKKALTFAQLRTLIEAAEGPLQNAIILMAHSLNIGEACAMTLGHIQSGSLIVEQQIVQPRGGARVKRTLKTESRHRTIPIHKDAEAILRSNAGSMYLVQSVDGPPMLPNNLHRELDELLATLDIPRVTPHELRHTCITLLETEIEAPQPIVCRIAGKTYKSATSGYVHPPEKRVRAWTERYFSELMSASLTNETFCQG